MLKSGFESLASSADSVDISEESIDYAKMIETFRRIDKKCCGYLTKNQYKKFLHEMKIYQTEEFEEITYRALVTENQTNETNSDPDNEVGITFEMARVICETFGSSSLKANSQLPKPVNRSRRSSNASTQSQTHKSDLNTNSNDEDHNTSKNKNENNNLSQSLRGNNEGNIPSNYRASDTQLPSAVSTNSSNNSNLKVERNASAPLPKESRINDFLPLRRSSKSKTEKNGLKTKICSLILFRGVDIDRDGKIDFNQFKSIAKIVDINMKDEDIATLFESCLPENHLVTYANVAKQLFDVFVWGNEDPYQQRIVNSVPVSRICLLL